MMKKIFAYIAIVACVVAVPQQLVRPCNLDDYKCFGDNFAANSQCSRSVQGSIPNAYKIKQFKFETPYFNATYIDNDLVIRNHDRCFVSEFFFNVPSDTSLITIECPGLVFESNRTLIQHYTKKEDTIYSYLISATYPLVSLTINFQHSNKIDLCSSFAFADVAALPKFNLVPNNKPTKNFLSYDLSYLYIYERETFFYRANQLARKFINSKICNFGCDA